jgi:hypothetical protein
VSTVVFSSIDWASLVTAFLKLEASLAARYPKKSSTYVISVTALQTGKAHHGQIAEAKSGASRTKPKGSKSLRLNILPISY